MPSAAHTRYEDLTWPEMKTRIAEQPIVMVPVGVIEDHGPHLPLDVDNFLVTSVCRAAAEKAEGEILLMPTVGYGFSPHHMDFPGTVTVEPDHFMGYLLDITKSVAYHGFKRIVIVNGHGSNAPLVNLVARQTVLQTQAVCASVSYWSLASTAISALRESDIPGGICHACELETSLYMFLAPDRVRTDKIQREMNMPHGKFVWYDIAKPSPATMTLYWSQVTETGIAGDPTLASPEKGRRFLEACVENLVEFAREIRSLEVRPRVDHH